MPLHATAFFFFDASNSNVLMDCGIGKGETYV